MRCRLVIDGNAVYEIDEECVKKKQGRNSAQRGPEKGGFSSQEKPGKTGRG